VTPWWNAAAISGEYLSAASFLGVAGLMLKFGASRCGCRSASPRAT
jgi:Na+(H+)/acetate symporter ActP